ncbi:RNA polymerase sigma factor SigJ [Denitrobaculum tricleocarpae]|uniref:Sigma-70 family RNA polymerase sigma factor n=1 Tax=Denitrobaculum tricleocarpae TaxID=2591009 RepID=A0A545T0E1_9PROT|nr:RNA polymerase sigma factor SigJ [Denitrobaculum tricleocarpae]TQV70649.1 sigma-70 family RNA polymerase sigma factor [Denitrobaculum tricleocarpae]
MVQFTRSNDAFEAARPMLTGLAYRILGSMAEAEDVVQDTYLSWMAAARSGIERPSSWLATVCTRKAIDSLRSAHHARTNYVGTWLPEPIHTRVLETPESELALSQNVTTAFLLVLERLAPKERAAFLLRDVFAMDYAELAEGLRISEAACRKLVSRARANLRKSQSAHSVPLDRQDELVTAFKTAIVEGSVAQLTDLLASDATLSADSGGKVTAIRQTLEGADAVLSFIARVLSPAWQNLEVFTSELNARRALVAREAGRTVAVVSFDYDKDLKASRIYIVRNPDKLARVGTA